MKRAVQPLRKKGDITVYRIEMGEVFGIFYDAYGNRLPNPTNMVMPFDDKLAIPNSKSGASSLFNLVRYFGLINLYRLFVNGYKLKKCKVSKDSIIQTTPYIIFKTDHYKSTNERSSKSYKDNEQKSYVIGL